MITLTTKQDVFEFIDSCDGYGLTFTDEDALGEFLLNHYGIEDVRDAEVAE